ncbi:MULTISPECIES: carbohydrate ABC transporter permease [Paenibacillus]|jgi:raffinose/stachyose/melibiose transport system permease protein|uniref:Sugar ABC transporter permease n=2 Tax=Paenibacillus TaxID=44249 RepID=A0AAJ3MHK2_PAEPO|nr:MULTISPECIES: sugar ABC transporter permease [Paenibacillus]ALA42251.1 sugar ABC transporter permease [Paenibacillus peoriae]APB76025.1 sn-glycerol-3-phosphate ABC transporter permease UgpA [Paenibacillus polymyxa]APQ59441.1 sugar ABC transporter permease [Paenibacillus polymyxa]MCP3747637.1 sugar ABC transporter permease [Paenibacillus sp. A3M_27_13]MDH2334484.1 sugar ABC transporter permease [Paenibacillus polymyxa]
MNKYLGNKPALALFLLPALILYSVILIYPVLQTVLRSFYEWDGLSTPIFSGLSNYRELFSDPLLSTSLKNGLIFAIVLVVFQIGLGTLLALICADPRTRGRKILKTAYFIPVVLSVTVVCQLWIAIYDPTNGLINRLFDLLNIPYQQNWLSSPTASIIAIAFVNAWQFMGYQFALLYAGVKSVPEDYFEAATIDGCSKWRAHLHVTLPLMRETYKFCFIIAITSGIGAFVQMLIMTNGGPGTTNYTMTFMIYRYAFMESNYGYACAVSVLLVLISLLATLVINKLFDRGQTA